jgi:hypothetical protein
MKMMSLKLPDDLLREVEEEARRTGLTKSQVIRRLVEEGFKHKRKVKPPVTCADLAGDLIGSLNGPPDLSTNRRYLEEAIWEDFEHGRRGDH